MVLFHSFQNKYVDDKKGDGLKLIADELKGYPEIELRWFEKGLQFQVQFIKKDFAPFEELSTVWDQVGTKLGLS